MTNSLKILTKVLLAFFLVALNITIPSLKTILIPSNSYNNSYSQNNIISLFDSALSAITNPTTVSAVRAACGYGSCVEFSFPDITVSEDPNAINHTETYTVLVNQTGTPYPVLVTSSTPTTVTVTPDSQCTLAGNALPDTVNPGSFVVPVPANSASFTVTTTAIDDGILEAAIHPCDITYNSAQWGIIGVQTVHVLDSNRVTITTIPPANLSENSSSAVYNQVFTMNIQPKQSQPIAVHVILNDQCYAYVNGAWHTGIFDTNIESFRSQKLILLQAKPDRIIEPVQNCAITTSYRLSGETNDNTSISNLISITDYTPDLILQSPAKLSKSGVGAPMSSDIKIRLPSTPSDNYAVNVRLKITSTVCTLEKSIITFTAANWNIDQNINVTAVNTGEIYTKEKTCPILITVESASSMVVNPPIGFVENYSPPVLTYDGHVILRQIPTYSLAAAEYNGASYTLNASILADQIQAVRTLTTPELASTGMSSDTLVRAMALVTIFSTLLFGVRLHFTKTWNEKTSSK